MIIGLKRFIALVTFLSCFANLALTVAGQPASPSGLQRGEVIFFADFEGTNGLDGWSGPARLQPGFSGTQAAALERKAGQESSVIARSLAVESLRGCTIRATAMVRAQEVSAKPNAWNGLKFMLVVQGTGGSGYPQATLDTGSFDWRLAAFTARIPADVTNVTLVLGLENVTGRAWFDDVKLTITKLPVTGASKPLAGARFKGHALSRLRGTMISPGIDPDSLRVLGHDWNANLIRWQLIRSGPAARDRSPEGFDRWLEGELRKLDAALPYCQENGLLVVVDLHSPPGGKPTTSGYVGSDSGLFSDKQAQEKFVRVWSGIAARYKDAKAIWGYDLANEPVEEDVEEDCADWQALAGRAAVAIRAVDPQRAIVVEPAQWGSPEGLSDLLPLPVSNVVYSVHMYIPHAFTHQGVFDNGPAYRYPGEIQGKQWNKAELERALQPVVEFQNRYNVHIYIGEFSAIRWAPDHSACRYLSDLIDIFEAHEWDWSYHAFRESQGWSVEHGSEQADDRPAIEPTDRERLLRSWFGKNAKPW
ncbi:MAG TPA: cellulase family glycosylhydrolase [Verrucomicrobiae bacterium]